MRPALNIGAVRPEPSEYTLSARLGNPPTASAPKPPLADSTNLGNKSARAAPRLAAAALTSVCKPQIRSGEGSNCKNIVLHILEYLIGNYAVTITPALSLP